MWAPGGQRVQRHSQGLTQCLVLDNALCTCNWFNEWMSLEDEALYIYMRSTDRGSTDFSTWNILKEPYN